MWREEKEIVAFLENRCHGAWATECTGHMLRNVTDLDCRFADVGAWRSDIWGACQGAGVIEYPAAAAGEGAAVLGKGAKLP